jgi:hypothetical protein
MRGEDSELRLEGTDEKRLCESLRGMVLVVPVMLGAGEI